MNITSLWREIDCDEFYLWLSQQSRAYQRREIMENEVQVLIYSWNGQEPFAIDKNQQVFVEPSLIANL
jgi:hypothetical protein